MNDLIPCLNGVAVPEARPKLTAVTASEPIHSLMCVCIHFFWFVCVLVYILQKRKFADTEPLKQNTTNKLKLI